MNRHLLAYLGIAVLLLFFCNRIWDMGTVHHDDAEWRLSAYEGQWERAFGWAKSQGRIYAYVTGALLFIGVMFQDTLLGSLLHVGAFVVFFAAFHAIAGVYTSVRVALLAATLNLALFGLRWEGSIVTAYPLFSWTLASIFLLAVYLGWRYSRERQGYQLWLSLGLLFISLNTHEGASVLFGLLAVMAVIGNYYLVAQGHPVSSQPWQDRAFLRQLITTSAVVGFYFATYVGWRLMYPSQYPGNQLGSFNPTVVAPVLMSLSGTGSVFADLISPYSVAYSDVIAGEIYTVVYRPLHYLAVMNPTALVTAGIVALLCFRLVAWEATSRDSTATVSSAPHLTRCRLIACIMAALAIAIVPVLPVALVGKYQDHFFNLRIRSHCYTPFCHFGWMLLLAVSICYLHRNHHLTARKISLAVVVLALAVLTYCSTLKNDAIASDMRRESARWRVVDQVADITATLERPVTIVHAPRLQNGSWFTVMSPEYWSNYVKVVHDRTLAFENADMTTDSVDRGVVYVDYLTDVSTSRPIVFAASLTNDPQSTGVIADQITVSAQIPEPSANAQYVLSYQDLDQGFVTRRLAAIPLSKDSASIRSLQHVRAVPGSIQIGLHNDIRSLRLASGSRFTLGAPIIFGTATTDSTSGGFGGKWLSEGWHPAEARGVWSSGRSATVSIPLAAVPRETLAVTLYISSYTGLGYSDIPQTLEIKIGERTVASHKFVRGDRCQPLRFEINPSNLGSESLPLVMFIDPPLAPSLPGDTRTLGVHLQKLIVETKGQDSLRTATLPTGHE